MSGPPDAGALPPAATVRTLAQLLAWRVACTPDAEAYREFDGGASAWRSLSWAALGQAVERHRRALVELSLARGARVATLLPNGVAAVCVDQAALAAACVPLPMHALDNPASIAWILADSEAEVLFAASDAQWQRIAAAGVALPALKAVVVQSRELPFEPPGAVPLLTLARWLELPEAGAERPSEPPRDDELAALVYTSGTTGRPKGVMLTHANVLSNVRAALTRFAPAPGDLFLSFLPLSHTFERTAGYYLPIAAGACVAFSRSVQLLPQDLLAVRPTALVSVPRIYEKVHAQALATLGGVRGRVFEAAVAVGWRRFRRRQQAARPSPAAWLDAACWPLLDRLVGLPLRARFGGRLRIAVSGGAPLAPAIARCFLALGIEIVQGYGMTETSPVVAANAPGDNDPATVGRALPGIELRLGANQELQVRGPNVMRGYWKRPEETAAAFVDGWLRTGDQAGIEDGRVRILGRLKEIIVTATGEKIAPADVEQAIAADPLFQQSWAFGDGRPFIACAVVLDAARWAALAERLGLAVADPASLEAPAARAAVMERIERLTAFLPRHGQPRQALLTLEPWTLENGLLTPTLKLKRHNLQARFAPAIERLYAR